MTNGIYYLIIRPGYLTDNRVAKNRIDSDIVVYPFTTLVIPKTDWWQQIERNIPVVITNGWQLVGYEITSCELRINRMGPSVIGYADTIERSQSREILNSLFSTQIESLT